MYPMLQKTTNKKACTQTLLTLTQFLQCQEIRWYQYVDMYARYYINTFILTLTIIPYEQKIFKYIYDSVIRSSGQH